MKTCTKCNETKAVSEFYKAKSNKDGFENKCKACKSISGKKERFKSKDRKNHMSRLHYSANRELKQAQGKVWNAANADRKAAIVGKNVRKQIVSATYDINLCIPFYEMARRLTEETGIKHEVDHIKPVSAGGLHCQTNLQVLTKIENMKKGSKWTSI